MNNFIAKCGACYMCVCVVAEALSLSPLTFDLFSVSVARPSGLCILTEPLIHSIKINKYDTHDMDKKLHFIRSGCRFCHLSLFWNRSRNFTFPVSMFIQAQIAYHTFIKLFHIMRDVCERSIKSDIQHGKISFSNPAAFDPSTVAVLISVSFKTVLVCR